jgi:LCP family protein required for cell wall assembly
MRLRSFTLLVVLIMAISTPLVLNVATQARAQGGTRVAPPPTNTARPSSTPTLTLVPTSTLTPTPDGPPTSTYTPSPTPEPTLVIMGTYATPVEPLTTAIPPRLEPPPDNGDDIVTVLLLGSDSSERRLISLTDVIVVLAINRTRGTVSMLHFPRDLYVYAPNDTMRKLNTVGNRGVQMYGRTGAGILMKETLAYNFGIEVDFYARVGFTQFQEIIAELGGLLITVDCAIEGNRLIAPELDPNLPESYEVFTLNIGLHRLSPYMALWYVRSRGSTSDLDRGRRQIEVLTAIYRQARNEGLLEQMNTLWPQIIRNIETDMTLADMLGLLPVATVLDPASIQRFNPVQGVHFNEWYTSDNGAFAWLPERDAWQKLISDFMLPPTRNRIGGENATVEVAANEALAGYEQVATNRLAWEGFIARALPREGIVYRDVTAIYDYTGGAKPSGLEAIRKALRVPVENVIDQPDPNATVDFRVEMGRSYGTSCFYGLPQGD